MAYESEHDPDLIARIYADDGSDYADKIIKHHLNQHYVSNAGSSLFAAAPSVPGSREPTMSPASPGRHQACLELRFSSGPGTSEGFVFGMASTCDVVLPRRPGVSNRHFAVTFNEAGHLVVRDFSKHGTAVVYDGHGKHMRRDFQWIIGGVEDLEKIQNITIPLIQICILPNKSIFAEPDHFDKVAVFYQGTATTDELLTGLAMNRRHTEPTTSSQSPTRRRIILEMERIASGGFGQVTRCWDVATGQRIARKVPLEPLSANARENWVKEIEIMKGLRHPHIVSLLFTKDGRPAPAIFMDFYALGNLWNQYPYTQPENVEILTQCLRALEYLHVKKLTHRDIKPPNILVKEKSHGHIHILLSDFGLSKEGSKLQTFCGTEGYLPPEIIPDSDRTTRHSASKSSQSVPKSGPRDKGKEPGTSKRKRSPDRSAQPKKLQYTKAVDIWSLGVVVLEMANGTPRGPRGAPGWCEAVVNAVQAQTDELALILQRMIVIQPERRDSTTACLRQAERLLESIGEQEFVSEFGSFDDRSGAPTPSSHVRRQSTLVRGASGANTLVQQASARGKATIAGFGGAQVVDWVPSLASENDPVLVGGGTGYAGYAGDADDAGYGPYTYNGFAGPVGRFGGRSWNQGGRS